MMSNSEKLGHSNLHLLLDNKVLNTLGNNKTFESYFL